MAFDDVITFSDVNLNDGVHDVHYNQCISLFLAHLSFLNVDFFKDAISSIAEVRYIVMTLLWHLMTSSRSVM